MNQVRLYGHGNRGTFSMKRYIRYLINILFNIYTALAALFIRKDDKIIVIGSWMGKRFADNSRYLFQFLSQNKESLDLKHVVWITRDKKIYDSLNSLGYEVCMSGTKQSRKWHLRAGIHIICNNYSYGNILPDIDTRFSWKAKKIQLWHGVGMKAVGKASNSITKTDNKTLEFSRMHHRLISMLYEGGWSDAYVLSTSEVNAEINKRIFLLDDSRIIRSAYPRNCECIQLLSDERLMVQKIKDYKTRILYLPTFRDDNSKYIHPLTSNVVQTLIRDNKILWIEKAHSADKLYKAPLANKYVMELDTNFDCNILYPYIDIVITDYSSVAFDGIYKSIPTIMYSPDYEDFKNGNVGFLFDVKEKCGSIMTYDIPSTVDFIRECINGSFMTEKRERTYKFVRHDFFDNKESDYNEIWQTILLKINEERR